VYFRFSIGTLLFGVMAVPIAFSADVQSGFDLLQTQPGAFFDATAFGLGIIPMVGRPIGPWITDTIIERDNGFTCPTPPCGGNTVNIHVFAQSLESAAPINIGGSFFDVFYDINDTAGIIPFSTLPQPDALNPSTGIYTVDEDGTGSGGTYDMSLTVWADVILTAVGQGPNSAPALGNSDCSQIITVGGCHFAAPAISLSSTGGVWQTTWFPNDLHNATYPAGGFYTTTMGNVTGPHPLAPAVGPEPASSLLFAGGMLGIIGQQLRKRRCGRL
jgi:hypothetical protein